MTRYIFSIIAAFFITLSSWAQGGLPSRYNVSYLNMAAGMPNNFADDIFQDSYGFVWISTHGGGLVRYDPCCPASTSAVCTVRAAVKEKPLYL